MANLIADTYITHLLTNPATLAIGGGLLVAIISIVSHYWSMAHADSLNAGLKRDMLERGMSAEEIATVINAGRSTDEALAKMAKDLAENGMGAEDIAKVIAAGREPAKVPKQVGPEVRS